MNRLQEKYKNVVVPQMMKDFDVWMEVKQMSDKSFKAIVKGGRWYNEMY